MFQCLFITFLGRWAAEECIAFSHSISVVEVPEHLLEEEDKEALRQTIVSSLATTNTLIRPQIMEMLRHIIRIDFPERLNSLFPKYSASARAMKLVQVTKLTRAARDRPTHLRIHQQNTKH